MLPMAPRRNSSNSIVHQQPLLLATGFHNETYCPLVETSAINIKANRSNTTNTMPPMQTSSVTNNQNSKNNYSLQDQKFTRCCLPNGDCLKLNTLIAIDDVSDCVRVLCNNENCNAGQYMHRECFDSWEQTVLVTLKTIGRARAWSDRQRSQNLWTKKGFDLVYKACGCKCGRGQIRKDLEWSAQVTTPQIKNSTVGNYINGASGQKSNSNGGSGDDAETSNKKKKKRSRNNQKHGLVLTLNSNGYHPNTHHQQIHSQTQKNDHNKDNMEQNIDNITVSVHMSSSNVNTDINNSSNSDTKISTNRNVGVIGSGLHNSHQQLQHHDSSIVESLNSNVMGLTSEHIGNVLGLDLSARASSLSTTGSGSTSPSVSHSSDVSISPIQHNHQHPQQQFLQLQQQYQQSLMQNRIGKGILNVNNCLAASISTGTQLLATTKPQQAHATANTNGLHSSSCIDKQQLVQEQKNKEVEIYSERVRSTSGCNGIFSRRLDFSSFNLLPKTRLNSYQVKIEDEGNHGNDETRLFILSSLAQSQMSRVACILCENSMLVFDRYPLVDGSFFLSPKQYAPGCIEVKYEGRSLFLTCVCMSCLDGTATNRSISCRFCCENWDGSNLVLGTMYAYDIFAAMPCCAERLKCNNCFKLLLHPQQRLNFYSDYSHCVTCPYCTTQDTHFVKPLSYCYTRNVFTHQLIA